MSDREALAAALGKYDKWTEVFGHVMVAPVEPNDPILAAARERLAQLPEKCEHGAFKLHKFKVQGDREVPSRLETCPGKVYPAELVERIAQVLDLTSHSEQYAVAVLDALNGETP